MIHIPTTFVLGAGASKTYGYPLGIELRKAIIEVTVGLENQFPPDLTPLFEDFRDKFAFSSIFSIDRFLAVSPHFEKVGKLSIASRILEIEKKLDGQICSPKTCDNFQDHWVQYVFNKLATSFEDFRTSRVSFITFNYDLSLERLLYQMAVNTFSGTKREDIVEALSKIQIVHVHGAIGYPPWKKGPEEGGTVDAVNVLETAAQGLKIVYAEDGSSETFKNARKVLAQAKNIYFLGFSYDPQNIENLGINDVVKSKQNGEYLITGSIFGLTAAHMEQVKQRIPSFRKLQHLHNGHQCVNFLEHNTFLDATAEEFDNCKLFRAGN